MSRKPRSEAPGLVEQLKQAIRSDGRSLNKIGDEAGVDSGTLSRFMRGKRSITLDVAEKLFRALDLRVVRPEPPPPAAAEAPPAKRQKRERRPDE